MMITLAKAKEIIGRADSGGYSDLEYLEIDADAVYDEDWEHLGDDYFYSESKKLIAGPCSGGPTRTLTRLGESVMREYEESETAYDMSFEWDRQVGEESGSSDVQRKDRLIPMSAEGSKRQTAGGKCTCDT